MTKPLTKTFQLYKDAYSGHPKEVWALTLFTLINRMGTMVLPFLTVYLTTILKFPLAESGLLASAFGFGSLAGVYLGGRLADRMGGNFVIINSLVFGGIMLIVLSFVTSFYPLFAAIFVSALFGEAYRPAVMSAVGSYVGKSETGRSTAMIRLAMNLGFSMGPFLGGFVAASMGYQWLFWIDGTTCILAATYFFFITRHWKRKSNGVEKPAELEETGPIIAPHKNKKYLIFLLSTFVMGFGFIQWFQSVPVFIKTEWHFDERYIGIIMAMNGLLIAFFEMPAVHLIEKASKSRMAMRLGLILIATSFLPFLFPKALFLCFLAMILVTVGEILFFSFNTSSALNMSPPSKRGEYMAWYSMAWSMTHILGPTLGLAFVGAFGFSAFWAALAGMMVVSLVINVTLEDNR